MALPSIVPADFTGPIKITANTFQQEVFQGYIDWYYPLSIERMVGSAFLEYAENTDPLPTRVSDLLNGVYYDNVEYEERQSNPGLRPLCLNFIYSMVALDNFSATNSGLVKPKQEVSDLVPPLMLGSIARQQYNNAVMKFNYQVIAFLENYQDFSQEIDSISDLGGGFWQINTSQTKYLLDGDAVEIGNVVYVVSNVVDGVSFQVNGDQPSGDEYISNPYESLIKAKNIQCLEYMLA